MSIILLLFFSVLASVGMGATYAAQNFPELPLVDAQDEDQAAELTLLTPSDQSVSFYDDFSDTDTCVALENTLASSSAGAPLVALSKVVPDLLNPQDDRPSFDQMRDFVYQVFDAQGDDDNNNNEGDDEGSDRQVYISVDNSLVDESTFTNIRTTLVSNVHNIQTDIRSWFDNSRDNTDNSVVVDDHSNSDNSDNSHSDNSDSSHSDNSQDDHSNSDNSQDDHSNSDNSTDNREWHWWQYQDNSIEDNSHSDNSDNSNSDNSNDGDDEDNDVNGSSDDSDGDSNDSHENEVDGNIQINGSANHSNFNHSSDESSDNSKVGPKGKNDKGNKPSPKNI